jgi:ankyrin repeat protein
MPILRQHGGRIRLVKRRILGIIMRTFLRRILIAFLIALAWSIPAFCGEIHDAVMQGDLAKVEALIKDNPDLVLSKDNIGETPLHIAAAIARIDMINLLLANKANVNAKEKGGWTPLHLAAYWDHKGVAELLMAHKADINSKTSDGATPLDIAARESRKDMVDFLLAHGAEVNARDKVTAFRLAAVQGDLDKVKELITSNPILVFGKDEHGDTPLHWAARSGDKVVIGLLLANMADVNAKNGIGWTPLLSAVRKGNKDVMQLLLAHGANVNARDNQDETPLHWAVLYCDRDMIEYLLANKADVNAQDIHGFTPLRRLRGTRFADKIELLRQHGGHE